MVSTGAHIYAKVRLRPRQDSDLDDYYHEFEDQHPDLQRYDTWCRVSLTGVVVSMLLVFLAIVL